MLALAAAAALAAAVVRPAAADLPYLPDIPTTGPMTGPSVAGQSYEQSLLTWSGRPWLVKSTGLPGPDGAASSSASTAVWVDAAGRLHLRLVKRVDGTWAGPELVGAVPLGYGTYRWTLASSSRDVDPRAALGMFVYDPTSPTPRRELDLEVGLFGHPVGAQNGQFVVQPYYAPNHMIRYKLDAAARQSVHQFVWAPGRVTFSTYTGAVPNPRNRVATFTYTGPDVPASDGMLPITNLWLYQSKAPSRPTTTEVVISSFTFIPAG